MTNRVELSISERFPFAGGHEFGAVGTYERLVGRAHFAVDPHAPAQQGITDIDKAPVDAEGLVHFTGDFSILKPADPARCNRRIFFDYGNRGNKRMLQFFNDAPASNDPRTLAHAGNGFLMRRGYAVIWLAWQGDLLPGNGRMVLDLPTVPAVTGPVRVEYIADRPGLTTFPLSGHASTRSHPTVSLDPREARLTRRRYPDDERIPVPPESWHFARIEGGFGLDNQGVEQALIPSDTHIHIPGGFEPGWIYELVYTGRDPLVLGLGHVAVRDFVSFLRYGADDPAGLGEIEKAYTWGSVANRALHPRFCLSRLQRRRRPQGVRRDPAACRRGRAQMAEPSLCERGRIGRPAIRGPLQSGRHVPVLLRRDYRPPDRAARCDSEAARDRSLGHPHANRDRILAAARITRSYRHTWQRPAATAYRAGLFLGQLAAFCRPDPETAGARHSAEFSQYRRDFDAVPRDDRRDGPLGDGCYAPAPAASRSAPRVRWFNSRNGAGSFRRSPAWPSRTSPILCRCWISAPKRSAES
jgi:hypothetical protein